MSGRLGSGKARQQQQVEEEGEFVTYTESDTATRCLLLPEASPSWVSAIVFSH